MKTEGPDMKCVALVMEKALSLPSHIYDVSWSHEGEWRKFMGDCNECKLRCGISSHLKVKSVSHCSPCDMSALWDVHKRFIEKKVTGKVNLDLDPLSYKLPSAV